MHESKRSPNEIVIEIFDLYLKYGSSDYIGEPVSQLEHMSQAASFAEAEGYDNEVILAAFFHDIGHFCQADQQVNSMDGFGNVDHEMLGANFLSQRGFSKRLVTLVQSHVLAKRYLTFKYPDYFNNLSEASKVTLIQQGGKMDQQQTEEFELDPDAHLYIRFRHWDDMAKLINVPVNNIEHLKIMALAHLEAQ